MYEGRTVFAQLMDYLPRHTFRRLVARYKGDLRARNFTCWDQFLCMAFAQLTFRGSLRDIEACLGAVPEKLYHLGFRTRTIARSTLADANEGRDWRIYAEFAQRLVVEARRLYVNEPLGLEELDQREQNVYALDATTIDLCLSVFPWARFRSTKAGIKMHTLLDLRGSIPLFIWITDAKVADVRVLDALVPEPGSIYLFDRAYVDFRRLNELTQAQATFVTRTKKGIRWERVYSRPVDRSTGLVCDQTIKLTGQNSAKAYPAHLRRVAFKDPATGKKLSFLTNNFVLPALTIANLYRLRWRVELFFKWIKQHLKIKTFYGTSLNAVKTQIWIAICVYLTVAIARKRLGIERDLYTILQILSVHAFEKAPLAQVLSQGGYTPKDADIHNQLS
ncbi:MAG: IS4 family transposase, partial [Woeseia sp.]